LSKKLVVRGLFLGFLKTQRFIDIILKTVFGQRTSTRITFNDGTDISFDTASYLLKKEVRLRSGPCTILDGVIIRDVVGVIENHKPTWRYDPGSDRPVIFCTRGHHGGMSNEWFKGCLHNENDTQPREIGYTNDEESMEIRAKHMSQYILKKKNLVH
jgi:hypothetical protein